VATPTLDVVTAAQELKQQRWMRRLQHWNSNSNAAVGNSSAGIEKTRQHVPIPALQCERQNGILPNI